MSRQRSSLVCLALAGLLALSGSARAAWPYLTEEASSLAEGHYSLSGGVSYARVQTSSIPGGDGMLWSIPELEGTLGVGSRAEVSFQYQWFHLEAQDGTKSSETGDLRLWTKVSFRPPLGEALGIRFGIKLPNASREHGLGTNQTDFFASLLSDFRMGQALLSLNAGMGILDTPEGRRGQDDVVTWGGSIQYPIGGGFYTGFDASGHLRPYGDSEGHRGATFAAGAGWRDGAFRVDLAGRRGAQDARGWGWVAGVTYER